MITKLAYARVENQEKLTPDIRPLASSPRLADNSRLDNLVRNLLSGSRPCRPLRSIATQALNSTRS